MSDITLKTLDLKLDSIAADVAEITGQLKEMNGRQRTDHDHIIRLEERVSTHARLQVGLAAVLSAISAAIGSVVK